MSVGVGRILESVCLSLCPSVCLFVCSITQKRMIPKCSNLILGTTLRYVLQSDMVVGRKVRTHAVLLNRNPNLNLTLTFALSIPKSCHFWGIPRLFPISSLNSLRSLVIELYTNKQTDSKILHTPTDIAELSMGWVDPWVGLSWVELY